MRIYYNCSFKYSPYGFCQSTYDIEKAEFIPGEVGTQMAKRVLDTTLGQSIILAVSEKGTWLLCLVGMVEGDGQKYVNAVIEDEDMQQMLNLYSYVNKDYLEFISRFMECVYEDDNHFGYNIYAKKLRMLLDEACMGMSNTNKIFSLNNKLIYFEPLEEYENYIINVQDVFHNQPRNLKSDERKKRRIIGLLLVILIIIMIWILL